MSDLDDDGYPTEEALDKIRLWPSDKFEDLMTYVEKLWYYPDYFQKKKIIDDFDTVTIEYSISTGGWSGNESIIEAIEANLILCSLYWWSSRRGGHYVYRMPVK